MSTSDEPLRSPSGGKEPRERPSVYERYRAESQEPQRFAFEVGFDGQALDIEREELADSDGEVIKTPFDPDRIEIQTKVSTIDLLLSRIRNRMIDLAPDFQRRAGIWDDGRQSRLVESLLLRIPIPSFYAAELADGSWAMVDGIQRITAITRFMDAAAIGSAPLRLVGLEYLGDDFHGATFGDLSGRLTTRLRETEVIVHVIRPGTPEAVMFNIFARLNTGGMPLTRQEIRHALIPGKARGFLARLAEAPAFLSATGWGVSNERMNDREMVLRFLAFRMRPAADFRADDFDQFLAQAMHTVNRLPDDALAEMEADFLTALGVAEDVFGPHAFRKRWRGTTRKSPVNKALFEAVAVNLAALRSDDQDRLRSVPEVVVEQFYRLIEDPVFERSISVGTGDPGKVRTRFAMVGEAFEKVLARD